MSKTIIRTEGLYKSYPQASGRLEILKNISVNINKGESICIVGSSGAGKSTLLHLIGALDRPTSGKIFFNEKNLQDYTDDELASLRNEKMGFVFQFHHLLAEFTALENVMIPAQIKGLSQAESKERATTLLHQIGMNHRLTHYPSELSGGECQRVAIARALVNSPEVLFADEPTGNLDTNNGRIIEDLFFSLRQKYGITLIVVTHNVQFSTRFQRVIRLKDGVSV